MPMRAVPRMLPRSIDSKSCLRGSGGALLVSTLLWCSRISSCNETKKPMSAERKLITTLAVGEKIVLAKLTGTRHRRTGTKAPTCRSRRRSADIRLLVFSWAVLGCARHDFRVEGSHIETCVHQHVPANKTPLLVQERPHNIHVTAGRVELVLRVANLGFSRSRDWEASVEGEAAAVFRGPAVQIVRVAEPFATKHQRHPASGPGGAALLVCYGRQKSTKERRQRKLCACVGHRLSPASVSNETRSPRCQ